MLVLSHSYYVVEHSCGVREDSTSLPCTHINKVTTTQSLFTHYTGRTTRSFSEQSTHQIYANPQQTAIMSGSGPATEGLADIDHVTFANLAQHGRYRAVCPEWRKEHVSSLGMMPLTNTVHPALQQRQGYTHGHMLEALNDDTLQARRFATRILEANSMLPFWWTVFFSQPNCRGDLEGRRAKASEIPMFDFHHQFIPEETARAVEALVRVRDEVAVTSLSDPDPYDRLTSDQIVKTKAALLELASCVLYKTGTYSEDVRCLTLWWLRTPCSLPGAPSIIAISMDELSAHSAAMRGDRISQAWATISLGIKLAKQLAHAAFAASHSGADLNWSNQYTYAADEAPGPEIRMLEACLFGGVLRKELDEFQDSQKSHYTIDGAEGSPGLWIAYSDWPSADLIAMCGTLAKDGYQYEGPVFHREWHVPFSWLLTVVTDDFWDEVREEGILAMRPRQEIGYVMSRDGERKYGPHHAEELRGGIVPSGFSLVPRSYLMVRNDLHHEACGLVLFGGFDAARIPFMNGNH